MIKFSPVFWTYVNISTYCLFRSNNVKILYYYSIWRCENW